VALLTLYDDAATVASAALKLLPLDPAVTSGWLAELAPSMALGARAVAADRRPLAEQPAPAAVALELAAPIHQTRRERLFAS
jgi:urease accessory protein